MKSNQTSKCTCNAIQWQTEDEPGAFYDPGNKLPTNPAGLKVRRYWVGCPEHNGHSDKREPTALETAEALNHSH